MKSNRLLHKTLLSFLFLILLTFKAALSIADWTVLVYAQAKNNLNKFAAQNLQEMSGVGSNKNLNMLVQWYQPTQSGVWRYLVKKNKVELDSHLSINTDGNRVKDLVDSMHWAVSKYPAKKYILILWNHGVGILDPIWKGRRSSGLSPYSSYSKTEFDNPRTQIDGLEMEDVISRGILFNEKSRTYMNNQQLIEALKQIKTKVLGGKKIDILGMDACLMAMLEVGYQVKDFAKYMVGSQEVELAYGWDYHSLMTGLSSGTTTPSQLAQSIVSIYGNYYKNRIKFYTQSAIELENIGLIKDNVNQIVEKFSECQRFNKNLITKILRESRKSSIQFSNRSYIDVHSFYKQFSEKINSEFIDKNFSNINTISFSKFSQTQKNSFKNSITELRNSLVLGMRLIENVVIAKTAGSKYRSTGGLSAYFPMNGRIDTSYNKTVFAQDSRWKELVLSFASR